MFFKGSEFFEEVHVKNTIEIIKYLEKDESILVYYFAAYFGYYSGYKSKNLKKIMWFSSQKQVAISNKTKMLVLLVWSIVMEIRSRQYFICY